MGGVHDLIFFFQEPQKVKKITGLTNLTKVETS